MPDSAATFKHVLRPLSQRRTWVRALLRVLVIALLPAGAALVFGEPLLAGYFALWILVAVGPSTLIEATLARTKPLGAPFPLAWALFLSNLVLCLFASLQVVYLMREGSRAEAVSGLAKGVLESPASFFLLCSFFAVGLSVAGCLAQRKPSWRQERLGVGSFLLGAYLLTVVVLVRGMFNDESALVRNLLGWGMSLAIQAALYSLGFALVDVLERKILGAPELDNLADYLQVRMEERGPLQPPGADERDPRPGFGNQERS